MNLKSIKRKKQKEKLKKREAELLNLLGLDRNLYLQKLPRVIGEGKDFEVSENKKIGKKPSLLQRVIWLEEFYDATKDIREEILEKVNEENEKNKEKEKSSAFKVIE